MKAGTHNHLKVKRLKRLLGVPLYRVVGILETLWLLCADCCDEGNIGKFTDEEIADYLEWDGDASALVRALADSGWTDPDETHRYIIHDWLEHCPDYISERVRKRRARHAKQRNQTTYDHDEPDKTPKTRTRVGQAAACPTDVPSIPIPTDPIPTDSIQAQSDSGESTRLTSEEAEAALPNAAMLAEAFPPKTNADYIQCYRVAHIANSVPSMWLDSAISQTKRAGPDNPHAYFYDVLKNSAKAYGIKNFEKQFSSINVPKQFWAELKAFDMKARP